jgi:hypothetical protein
VTESEVVSLLLEHFTLNFNFKPRHGKEKKITNSVLYFLQIQSLDLIVEGIGTSQESSPSINIHVMLRRKQFIEGGDKGYMAMGLTSSSESAKVTAEFTC